MATNSDHSEISIRQAIIDRIRRAPKSADTLQGITTFWLPEVGVDAPPECVEQLLSKLVKEGVLISCKLPDGTELYSSPEAES